MKLAVFTIVIIVLLTSQALNDAKLLKDENFNNILIRFDKLLTFFESDYENVNVDGLYGIRIAEGTIGQLVHKEYYDNLQPKRNYDQNKLKLLLKELNQRLKKLSQKVTTSVQDKTPDYLKQFHYLVDKPFVFNRKEENSKKMINLNIELLISKLVNNKISDFNEAFSDKCYEMLMNAEQCQTNDDCLEYFTNSQSSSYFLTHQLLYFMIADHVIDS
jgi:hypothetical protein